MGAPLTNTITTSLHASSAKTLHEVKSASGLNVRTIQMVLKTTFSIVPVVAGADKFTNLLTNWENYLNPMLVRMLPFSAHFFMQVVGVIEIVAGVLVFYRPRVGALVVSAWLTCIGLSLLANGQYLDVAVRDLVMAVSAFALAGLSSEVESRKGKS